MEQFKLQERLETKNQATLKKRIKDLEDSLSNFNTTQETSLNSLQDKLRNKQRELEAEQNKWSHDYNQLLNINKSLESKLNLVILEN